MSPAATTAPLAVSMGDPAGIGLDITLMAWSRRVERRLPPFTLFADAEAVASRARALSLDIPLRRVADAGSGLSAFVDALPVVDRPIGHPVTAGSPARHAATATIRAIEDAVAAVQNGEAAAVVTNPIAKSVLYEAGFPHPGHTEFLADIASRNQGERVHPVMMLASHVLRVVPLTIHIPLAAVPKAITRDLVLTTVRVVHAALKRDFAIAQPRIAVCGLNPHAGESGTIGREDIDVIEPALRELKSEGMNVTGPHSADTLFHAPARAAYDVAICMYHDQALIPIKTLAFDEGVNVTLGLPFIRTSPDHGTAFSLAGTGKASPESFIASCKLAATMAARRQSFAGACT